jgi:hypothetical protein
MGPKRSRAGWLSSPRDSSSIPRWSNFCGSICAHAATDRLRLTELLFNSVTNSGETALAALIGIAPCPYWSLYLLA